MMRPDTRKALRHDLADSAPDPIIRQLHFQKHQPQSAADATCIGTVHVANCASIGSLELQSLTQHFPIGAVEIAEQNPELSDQQLTGDK